MTLDELNQVKKDLSEGISVSREKWKRVLDAALNNEYAIRRYRFLRDYEQDVNSLIRPLLGGGNQLDDAIDSLMAERFE